MSDPLPRPQLRAVTAESESGSDPEVAQRLDPRPPLIVVAGRNWLVLLAAGLLGALAGYVLSQFQSPSYTATGRIFLVDPNRDFGLDPDRAPYTDPLRYTRTRAELVSSGPVFGRVARALGTTPEDVKKRVRVLPSTESDLVTITGEADSPAAADRLVSLVQQHYEAVTSGAQQAPYRRAIAQVRRDRATVLADLRRVDGALEESPNSVALLTERQLLQDHYRFLGEREATLAANSGLLGSGVQLAETPTLEPELGSPKPMRNAAIGAMLGVVVLLGLLWWRAGRDPVAGAAEMVEPLIGAPLLVELRPAGRRPDRRVFDEAFDDLTAAVTAASDTNVLLVAPVSEDARRPALALWIASALGRGGRRTIVVDAAGGGLLTESMGGRESPGLSEAGGRGGSIRELVRSLEIAPGVSVSMLGAGRWPDMPDRTAPLGRALKELLSSFETVVVDAPAGGSLAAVVTSGVHNAGIAVATPETPVGAITTLRREFALLGVPLLGFVFVRGRLPGDAPRRSAASGGGLRVRFTGARLRRRRP